MNATNPAATSRDKGWAGGLLARSRERRSKEGEGGRHCTLKRRTSSPYELVVVDDAIIDHPTVEDRDARRLRWHGPSAGCELVSCCPRATKGGVRQDSSLQNTTCDEN
jgi:hypothetical protein